MFQYRLAAKEDAGALQHLWEECFPQDRGAFSDWYFSVIFRPQHVYVAETAEKIVGSLHAPPITMRVGEKTMPVPYLQGIATAVSHRNLGIARDLIYYSLDALREQGFTMAVLEPFLPLFYEKLGFRTFAKPQSLEIGKLHDFLRKQQPNSAFFNTLQTPAAPEQLNNIYEVFGKHFYSYPMRDSLRWQHLLYDHKADGGELFAAENAYLLYFKAGNTIKIRELAYEQESHAYALLKKVKAKLCTDLFVYTEQPQAMYYDLQTEQQKGMPVRAFPPYYKQQNYFNELF